MKKLVIFFAVLAMIWSTDVFAQGKDDIISGKSMGNGAFSAELLTYFAFSDHNLLKVDADFNNNKGKANTEFLMNIVELRVDPYEGGRFAIGLDFDWDYFRLDKTHFWQPDGSGRVTIAPMEGSGFKRIKKSRLSVRTLSVPLSFTQAFGEFSLRVGATAEYNFPGITRFKGQAADGSSIKEWKSGTRFSKDIKTNAFTYNVFAAVSYDEAGFYVKYCPVQVFEDGYGPQFQTVTLGLIVGLGI